MKQIDICKDLVRDEKIMRTIKAFAAAIGVGLLTLYICLEKEYPTVLVESIEEKENN